MQIAILAGGMATRLGALTMDRPKSMVDIQGKPFLEYQLVLLREAGIKNVMLCLGYKGEQIQDYFGDGSKYGINLEYSFERNQLGTAGALKNAEKLLNNVFFTIYGDSYLFLDFGQIMSFFESRNKLALMTVYRNDNQFARSNAMIQGNAVTKYSKNGSTEGMTYIDYGVSLFRKEVLQMVPENDFYPLDNLFHMLIENNELLAYEAKDRFYEIGSVQGLHDFNSFIKERA
jgi:MurNAc alpha-1-phosphate uridylyltransferase